MKTTDLFKTSAKKLNESLAKTFGQKLNLEGFDTPKLEDARNKLRTQVSQVRNESGFNETIENEALTKAQWMLDSINAEIAERAEHIVNNAVQEGPETDDLFGQWMNSEYAPMDDDSGDYNAVMQKAADFLAGQVPDHEISDTAEELTSMFHGEHDDEGGETDDGYALASAGFGSDEDYGDYGGHESIEMERDRDSEDWDEGNTEPANNFAIYINGKKWKVIKGKGQYADDMAERNHLRQLNAMAQQKSQATGKKWTVHVTGENPTESIQAEKFDPLKHVKDPTPGEKKAAKDVKRGSYADRAAMLRSAEADGRLKKESAPPTAKGERMVKHIKKGYAQNGKLTDKEKSIAYATAWKAHNKNESIEQTGDNMRNLREGEIQQASAIVTAKTMVDRVGRWIEELSGMENDTLLQLGDSIRDEMGQEQAKSFISAVAPAIQAALENLKTTRDTLSTGVRQLATGEQPDEMLGAEPGAEMGGEPGAEMGGDEMGAAEPDAMNMGAEEPAADEFGASDAAAGGLETAGREKRESIEFESKLLKVLAG
jgi:hypothetical protein